MPLWRVVESQHRIYEYNATSNEERAEHLRHFIERTKPEPYHFSWHDLVATPFRYPLPVAPQFAARFRPPGFNRNVFYGAELVPTALYEHAYWYFKFRKGLKKIKKTQQRTLFAAHLVEDVSVFDITTLSEVAEIMSSTNYGASHRFILSHPKEKVIKYPSCRDPEHRANFAVLEISALKKEIEAPQVISFFHNIKHATLHWIEQNLTISEKMF